jgi:RNA polymerase sigma-70 factor (sigma-E family)
VTSERFSGRSVRPSRMAELYERYYPDALRLACLVTGNRALAEDVVHEAFLRVFARFADLRDPDAFGPYLRRTVVNLTRKHFRRRKVESAYLERLGHLPQVIASEPDISDADVLEGALLRLPPRQRMALVLRFYEDLSERQTAEILRCRPGTVKSLVSRGLTSLRDAIGTDGVRS